MVIPARSEERFIGRRLESILVAAKPYEGQAEIIIAGFLRGRLLAGVAGTGKRAAVGFGPAFAVSAAPRLYGNRTSSPDPLTLRWRCARKCCGPIKH